jgi:hypothetical protein
MTAAGNIHSAFGFMTITNKTLGQKNIQNWYAEG